MTQVSIGLLAALGAALCFGTATVLQASAAQAEQSTTGGLEPRLLLRLLGRWRFVAGLGLDLLGYLCMVAALRVLPVFVVSGAVASSLAVTAVVASWMLGVTLRSVEWIAVVVVCVGLGMLAASAGAEGADKVGIGFRIGLVIAVTVLALVAVIAGRLRGRLSVGILGAVAGLGFGVVALASRVLTSFAPSTLLTDLATYVIVAAGVLAMLCFATALQRGSVTAATAALTIGETVLPAFIGLALLGDESKPGLGPVAVAGFVAAIAGALVLARFGEVPAPAPASVSESSRA